ncbi:MAG: hypothetical protein PVS2B2_08590 [Candidatus Acidiferrum sp.]
MLQPGKERSPKMRRQHAGFTLIEALVSLLILVGVSGIVMYGMNQLLYTQGTIANRTEMHTNVRSATEFLEQEIGQAGKIALPNPTVPVTLLTAVVAPVPPATSVHATITVSSGTGMFNGEQLLIDPGSNQETVTVSGLAAGGSSFTTDFSNGHAAGVPVNVLGAFSAGIVPPSTLCGVAACGSTGTVLKLFGDINSDGNMLYIEYHCDTVNGFLYRNQMAFDALAKPAETPSMILLSNLLPNPNDLSGAAVPCFTYQTKTVGTNDYVTDVAVTLTEQTQNPDPRTHQFQTETKALLNVSPRNVFDVWELASHKFTNRVQPIPASVTNLLP